MTPGIRQRGNSSSSDERERHLLSQIAAKDRDALSELYRIYHPRLFRFIYRLIRAYEAADELVNDVMMIVWRSASSYRGAARVSTWIFGIAYRQTMRLVSRKKLNLVPDIEPDDLAAGATVNVEREDWVRAGIDALPAAQQAAVILVFYQGLTCEEAAEIADCPVNTIKTRMFHARRKLKDILEKAAQPTNSSENGHA